MKYRKSPKRLIRERTSNATARRLLRRTIDFWKAQEERTDADAEFDRRMWRMYEKELAKLERQLEHQRRSSPPPGSNLRRLAQRLCSPASYVRVLEPALSDLAEEHALALAEHGPWRARYVRLRGYWSFWAAVAAHLVAAVGRKFSKLWARSRE